MADTTWSPNQLARLFGISVQHVRKIEAKSALFHDRMTPGLVQATWGAIKAIARALKSPPLPSTPTVVTAPPWANTDSILETISAIGPERYTAGNAAICSVGHVRGSIADAAMAAAFLLKLLAAYWALDQRSRSWFRYCLQGKIEAALFVRAAVRQRELVQALVWGFSYGTAVTLTVLDLRVNTTVTTVLFEASPYVSDCIFFAADRVVVPNPWILEHPQVDELYESDTIECGRPLEFMQSQRWSENPDKRNRVALYFSGIYARSELAWDSSELLEYYAEREKEFREFALAYARSCPDVRFDVYIHPTIEVRATVAQLGQFYGRLLDEDNVKIYPHRKGYSYFNEYELGISTGSSTILQRLDCGHKGIFVKPPLDFIGPFLDTSLRHVVIEDAGNLIEKAEEMRRQSREEFFAAIRFSAALEPGR